MDTLIRVNCNSRIPRGRRWPRDASRPRFPKPRDHRTMPAMDPDVLRSLGWHADFERQLTAAERGSLEPLRVSSVQRTNLEALDGGGPLLPRVEKRTTSARRDRMAGTLPFPKPGKGSAGDPVTMPLFRIRRPVAGIFLRSSRSACKLLARC